MEYESVYITDSRPTNGSCSQYYIKFKRKLKYVSTSATTCASNIKLNVNKCKIMFNDFNLIS